MKKKRTFTILTVLLAVLLLGVGYAATIDDILLNITGSATASPSTDQYIVKFVEDSAQDITTNKPSHITVTPEVTGDLSGTITVTGMKAKDESVTVQYTIANESADLSATLSVAVGTGKSDKFTITPVLGTTVLEKGGTTTLTVTITLNETPISADLTTSVPVTVTAVPTTPTTSGTGA